MPRSARDGLGAPMLSIQQHKLMHIQELGHSQLRGCSTAAAQMCAVLRDTRWLVLGHGLPLTALPKMQLLCDFFNVAVTHVSKTH